MELDYIDKERFAYEDYMERQQQSEPSGDDDIYLVFYKPEGQPKCSLAWSDCNYAFAYNAYLSQIAQSQSEEACTVYFCKGMYRDVDINDCYPTDKNVTIILKTIVY